MSEDCHDSNSTREVDAGVNLAQQPHDTADVYDEQEPHTAANQELDDLRRKAMGQPVAWAEWAADEAAREADHE